MATAEELKQALVAAFPPGVDEVVDFDDAPGAHLGAIAEVIKACGTDVVDGLAAEVNPLTCTQNLPRWERLFRIPATSATLPQRRLRVLSRWREVGATVTRQLVQAVLAPLLDYANAADVVVVEADRDALRAAHTYAWAGSKSFSFTPAVIKWTVYDDANVSHAGAQVDLTITHSDISRIAMTLTCPSGQTASVGVNKLGRGAASGDTYRAYFPSLAGFQVGGVMGGTWSLSIGAISGTGTITAADLFVEGVGRDSTHRDGRGASVWHWGVVVEDDKLGPNADLVAAREALHRISYACRFPALLRRSVGSGALPAGDFAAIPGDPNTLPGASLPGTA